MLGFRDWIVLDWVRVEIYEGILEDMRLKEARRNFLEFYNRAVSGRWDLILESDEEDDTPAEIDDPFASGDDNVKPSWVAEDDDDEEKAPAKPEQKPHRGESPVAKAKALKDAAQRVRWTAMLDRAELVVQVRKIYEDEWVPLMKKRDDEIRRRYQDEVGKGVDELDARREVGKKFGISAHEVGKIVAPRKVEWAVVREAGEAPAKLPRFGRKKSFEDELNDIREKVEPLLVKLGYLESGQLKFGDLAEKIELIDRAISGAAREEGNDPPDNEAVGELRKNPSSREKARSELMGLLHGAFEGTARGSWMASSSRVIGAEGKSKRGSQDHQGPEDILNQGIASIFRSLTSREPNKDMTVPPWREKLEVLTNDPNENPDQIIGSLGARFSARNAGRDEKRGRNNAAGRSGDSAGGVTYLSAGAAQDDGTQSSIDPEDARTSDSITTMAGRDTRSEFIEAFQRAMAELKDLDPLWAMLACIRLGLHCSADGSMPRGSANAILGLVAASRGSAAGQTPENFLHRLGQGNMTSGESDQDLADKVSGLWDGLKDFKKGRGARRSSPVLPDGTKITRANSRENAVNKKEWDKFVATVRDACGEAFKWLASRIHEIMGEGQTAHTSGQTGPKNWDLGKFLRLNFPEASIRETRPDPLEQEIKISFPSYDKASGRSFDILVKGPDISIIQDGFSDEHEFQIPDLVRCPSCGGADRECELCHGGGLVIDPKALRKLEWDIRNLLLRSKRKSGRREES